LMSFLDGNSEVLDALVKEMYDRGFSTRDVEHAFTDATGELLISKSAVSRITDRLWEDYQAFVARDLSEVEVGHLFVDAAFEALHRHGAKQALAGRPGASPPTVVNTCCIWPSLQGVRAVLDRVLPRRARPPGCDCRPP
jgi:Transposase, Mutator family